MPAEFTKVLSGILDGIATMFCLRCFSYYVKKTLPTRRLHLYGLHRTMCDKASSFYDSTVVKHYRIKTFLFLLLALIYLNFLLSSLLQFIVAVSLTLYQAILLRVNSHNTDGNLNTMLMACVQD